MRTVSVVCSACARAAPVTLPVPAESWTCPSCGAAKPLQAALGGLGREALHALAGSDWPQPVFSEHPEPARTAR